MKIFRRKEKEKEKEKAQDIEYYSILPLLSKDCPYSMVFSKRSNGKTYSALEYVIRKYFETGEQFVYIRRWDIDITGHRAVKLISDFNGGHKIPEWSGNIYDGIHYFAKHLYACAYNDDGRAVYNSDDCMGYLMALNNFEHDKSTGGYERVRTVIFDEFISSNGYLMNEFVLFSNVLSTIIRGKSDVRIIMLGNTVNKFCPYFKEMGLTNVQKMRPGDMDIYEYNNERLRVAVEYGSDKTGNMESNFYFAFDNPQLAMITKGEWQIGVYPHCSVRFTPENIIFKYFILYSDGIYECQVVSVNGEIFTFIFQNFKTEKIPDNTLIYTLEIKENKYYNDSIYRPRNDTEKKILWFFQHNKVFYADNFVGNAIQNFLNEVKK